MKYAPLTIAGLCLAAGQAQAFTQETHKRIVEDAVAYMAANPTTTQYAALKDYAGRAGLTVDQLASRLGQGAYDVDDFQDTFLCGAMTGDCVHAPVWGSMDSIAAYTSYWHFQNHSQGPDIHGNDFGGYNYDKLTVWGDVDNLAASWLKGDHLDDGPGGKGGWFGDDSEYDSYGITEANYRQGSHSQYSMYEDFETMPFQPIDNLGQYWYGRFLQSGSVDALGFTLHSTDLLQPHHTWTTSALNHAGWESWVRDYYDDEGLNNPSLVTQALASFDAIPAGEDDIRPLLTQGGALSYSQGGLVLNSQDHNERAMVGRIVVPHAIAMVVQVLNHAMQRH
ncbi:phospholipase [Gallaecimonas sp. GXIMD4217]|uniref:phospholipase n=1 Tax=Gallaecimonas sp. GXIMD4217 TaxID=3131927 RepID=UPI00311AFBA6